MMERVQAEVALVRCRYPDLEFRNGDLWARIPAYPVPEAWGRDTVELAFQAPRDVFGQQPYGFWVRPPLELPAGGPPANTSAPVATAFGDGWQQFSWAPEVWQPASDARSGSNLLDFVRSFAHRLAEIN